MKDFLEFKLESCLSSRKQSARAELPVNQLNFYCQTFGVSNLLSYEQAEAVDSSQITFSNYLKGFGLSASKLKIFEAYNTAHAIIGSNNEFEPLELERLKSLAAEFNFSDLNSILNKVRT